MLISQRPALTEEIVADNRSKFFIEPLEPGFGYTPRQLAAPYPARRSPVPPSPASASTVSCTSSPPSPV